MFKFISTHLSKLIFVVFIIVGHDSFCQHEFFHEIALENKLVENEKWECIGEVNFKHLYDEPAWRRLGVSFSGIRTIKQFKLSSGLNSYDTFNRNITDFFEVRPWSALQFNFPILSTIYLRQQLRYEWRFFFTKEVSNSKENYGRLRYKIAFDFPIPSKEESSWKIRPYFEWFFIKDPAAFERFSNERDFGLMAIKRFKNEQEFSFGFTREVYYDLNSEKEYGYIILLSYSF